ncbi:hypothetical protein Bca4012_072579 [Brassica carinata]|uniref:Uncharacterized protein n=1 Tax=Brassica carinata TaxID=52824 RepID=A0A8X7QHC1_BRACI|nr:hypothetical protein Bca52824_064949 [Brassica carinata]
MPSTTDLFVIAVPGENCPNSCEVFAQRMAEDRSIDGYRRFWDTDQSRDGSGQNTEAVALDDKGEEILGSFENAEVRCSDGERAKGDKVKRYFELTFEKKLREKVMGPYLRHVVAISEESKKSLRVVIIAKVWRRATDALVALV